MLYGKTAKEKATEMRVNAASAFAAVSSHADTFTKSKDCQQMLLSNLMIARLEDHMESFEIFFTELETYTITMLGDENAGHFLQKSQAAFTSLAKNEKNSKSIKNMFELLAYTLTIWLEQNRAMEWLEAHCPAEGRDGDDLLKDLKRNRTAVEQSGLEVLRCIEMRRPYKAIVLAQ